MLSLFKRKPVVNLTSYQEGTSYQNGTVFFTSERPLIVGREVRVTARIPEGGQFAATLVVIRHDPEENVYGGSVSYPHDARVFLPQLLPPRENRRRSARHKVTVGILSPVLPGYRAITVDVSRTGACLAVDSPLRPGSPMRLELDLDAPGTRLIQVEAQARWCIPKPDSDQYLVGAQFTGLGEVQREQLSRYLDYVERQQIIP